MLGEFRVRRPTVSGIGILSYGPRDLRESNAGVPHAAMAYGDSDKIALNPAQLAAFLNAALAASHGDFAPMNAICPKPLSTEAA